MILVFGATGQVGRGVVGQLKQKGEAVRAFARDPERAREVLGEGVEYVKGDLEDPSTYAPAMQGVDRVFLLSGQHPNQLQHQTGVIDAAKQAGVQHLVKLSGGNGLVGPESLSMTGRDHYAIEGHLKASSLSYTILRPSVFMQPQIGRIVPMVKQNRMFVGPFAEGKISLIDLRDVADAAAATLTEDGHAGESYVLTGPESVNFHDVARIIGDEIGADVSYKAVPTEAGVKALKDQGMPDFMVRHMEQMFTLFQQDVMNEVTDLVDQVTGHPPRSVAGLVKERRADFLN